MDEAVRLEIGSGERPTPGYVHNDIRELPGIDWVTDARCLDLFLEIFPPDEPITEIKAAHVLEHFSWRETVRILERWLSILAPGGMIHIEVPNLSWQCRAVLNHELPWSQMVDYIFGGQDYEGNYHKTAFTEAGLVSCLEQAGFERTATTDIGMVILADAFRPQDPVR